MTLHRRRPNWTTVSITSTCPASTTRWVAGTNNVGPTITPLSEPGPGATGDPQFHGLLGQPYQIHGIDDGAYSIISEPSLQPNERFDSLVRDGVRSMKDLPTTSLTQARTSAHWL